MNTLITHFIYALRKAWANKRVNVLRLGQFFIATLILSFAFGSAFELSDFDEIDIAYAAEDDAESTREYFDALSENDSFDGLVAFHEVEDFDEGRAKVQEEDYGAFIYAKKEFGEQIDDEDAQATLEVYSELYSGINYIVVSSVVDGFNNGANALWAARSLDQQLAADALSEESINQETVEQDRKMTALIYYAVGMLLFMMLFGTEYGSFGISEEYLGTMQMRSRLAPQKQWQMIIGKLSAYSLVQLLMAAIFMVATTLALGMDWGSNIGLVLLVVYSFGVMAIALGMAFMAITRDMDRTTVLIQVSVIGFTLLAGGFIATEFGGLEFISPNLYAREALFDAIFGDNIDGVWKNLGILWAITAVLVVVSSIASARKRAKA